MSFTVRRLNDRKRRSWGAGKALLLGAAGLARPLLQWMLQRAQEHHEEHERHDKRVHILQRTLIILCAAFLSLLLIGGIAEGMVALRLVSIQSLLSVSAGSLPVDRYGHTNILLLGAGDVTHDGVDLTDSIMIASIDPSRTKSVALLSLPRDLYFLQTEKMGKGRINSLYRDYKYYLMHQGMKEQEASLASLQELRKEVGDALGIEIHHVVKVDFIGFVQAVDAIGGVDVVVPEDLVDPEYPGPNYTYATFSLPAGPQHLDGETALKYARSRHSTSDFDRSARQQQILRSLSDRLREQGLLTHPNRILSLLHIMQEHVDMTMDIRTVLAIAKAALDVDRTRIASMQLNNENGLYGALSIPGGLLYNPPREQFEGASILLPVSVPEFPVTWMQVRLLVRLFLHERSPAARTPIAILNAGAPSGSGRKLRDELTRFGFSVDRTVNAGIGTIPSSILHAEDSAAEDLFATLLHLKTAPIPDAVPSDKQSPVTIILGKDYRYQSLQDLSPSTP